MPTFNQCTKRQIFKPLIYILYLLGQYIYVGKSFADEEPPNDVELTAEFLEFLAEIDDADDETYELILYHGIEDSKKETDETEQQTQEEGEND